ncbi:MAG TPA: hypothetical protein PLW98_04705, partial [Bacillota bacterium]|nr:hypothetical protein [Bacillota bacterium]
MFATVATHTPLSSSFSGASGAAETENTDIINERASKKMMNFEIRFIIYSLTNEFCSIYALYGISTSLCKCPSASLLFNKTVTKD